MSTAKLAKSTVTDVGALFTASAADAQARAAQHISQHNDLMINTARALWDSHARLLQLQADQAAALFALPAAAGDPDAMMAVCHRYWHDGSEQLIAHWRQVNDLMRDAGWQLFEAQAESLRQIARSVPGAGSPDEADASKA